MKMISKRTNGSDANTAICLVLLLVGTHWGTTLGSVPAVTTTTSTATVTHDMTEPLATLRRRFSSSCTRRGRHCHGVVSIEKRKHREALPGWNNIPRGGGGGRAAGQKEQGGHHGPEELMNGPTAIANVLADLCPHGMLPLAFGIGAAGATGPGLAVATLLVFGVLSWYSLLSFARGAEVSGTRGESLSSVWSETVSESTAWIPDVGCALLTVGCCLFYSAFLGDLFGALASGLLPKFVPPLFRQRYVALLCIHAVPILPLCLLRDLSALKYSSMLGLAGIVYTISFVAKRLWDQSYAGPGGKFFALMETHLQPAAQAAFPAATREGWVGRLGGYLLDLPSFHVGRGILTLMNMCCVAFACHYNSVKYYMELQDRRLGAFGNIMGMGVGGTALVFLCMMLLGYATFGANAQALLLNNYHKSQDAMATLARAFTGLAIVSGYPLMFAGLKSAMFALTKLDQEPDVGPGKRRRNALSIAMLSAIAAGACFVTEHELATVIGIVGSVFGSVVIYVFPAIISNRLLARNKEPSPGKNTVTPFFRGEALFNKILIVFGFVFAILGTWISLAEDGGGGGGGAHHS